MKKTTYVCPTCGAKTSAPTSASVPTCCGSAMTPEPLPVCTVPVSAESARTGDEDGPCADGATPRKS